MKLVETSFLDHRRRRRKQAARHRENAERKETEHSGSGRRLSKM